MVPRENSSSQSVVCSRQSFDWSMIDDEFCSIISPVHAGLGSDDISTEEAGELFSQLLLEHLAERSIIKHQVIPMYQARYRLLTVQGLL